jgi:F0F1-type ATP synthase membrane subunit c/vacuolar-type H+-ATPase subunit K
MIIIVGLVILVAAVANGASAQAQPLHGARLPRDRLRRPLFLYGIVAVAIALLGLPRARRRPTGCGRAGRVPGRAG